jgi:CHAT domain-containing protein
VAASLRRVDDAATAGLMSLFYRGMLKEKMCAGEALRAAVTGGRLSVSA